MLELLFCQRLEDGDIPEPEDHNLSYQTFPKRFIKRPDGLVYTLNAQKLQLDHLEPHSMNGDFENNKYYMFTSPEERAKKLDSSLGNFMIIDANVNNEMSNVPLVNALAFYTGTLNISWFLKDIRSLKDDGECFENDIPTDEFFKRRTKLLRELFIKFLDSPLSQRVFEVNSIDFSRE